MSAESKPAETSNSVLTEARAVLDLVFDFSFKRFVTPRLVRILYVLSILAALIFALSWMFSGETSGFFDRLTRLVTGPLAFLVYLLGARVSMEFVLAVFKIAENVERLNQRKDSSNPPSLP